MSTDYSGILSCSYGTSTLAVEKFDIDADPVVKPDLGRTSTRMKITIEGYIQGVNAADYQANLTSVLADLTVDGRDLVVNEFSTPIFTLMGARCLNGAPHIGWKMEDGDAALMKRFKLDIKAERMDGDGTAGPSNSYKIRTATRPDGYRTVTWTGEIIGPGSTAYFLSTVLGKVQSAYDPTRWVMNSEYESSQDANLSRTSYTLTVVEQFGTLPINTLANQSVEGEITTKADRDENYRLTTTTEVNLLIVGDPIQLLGQIRTGIVNGGNGANVILKENSTLTSIKEQRLTASFVVLRSADAAHKTLLNWTESVVFESADQGWEIKTYPGAGPVALHKPASVAKVTQSGTCVAAGQYKTAPSPLFSSCLDARQVTYTDKNDVEKETSWRYILYPSLAGNVPDPSYVIESSLLTFMLRGAQDSGVIQPKLAGGG